MSDFNETFVISVPVAGTLTAAAGDLEYPVPFPAELASVHASVGTAPTGAALLIDVNKNGSTIFSDQDDRVSIAVSETSASAKTSAPLAAGTNYIYTPYPTTTPLASFDEGDTVSVDVDQIGSSVAGADLVVVLSFVKK